MNYGPQLVFNERGEEEGDQRGLFAVVSTSRAQA